MALSYSGIVNYGKVTLPSVEGWSTAVNVTRDPPRSITTRKKERVGDTSAITATLAESDDRFCEAINYYARNVNPSVSVSYGEAGSKGSRAEAFLPYRVIRDGAFRPPILSQSDLLPLSRLPRNWTTIDPNPSKINYTLRALNCGTAETTKEVKNILLSKNCESRKTIAADPDSCPPRAVYMLKDPLAPGTVTNKSCPCVERSFERPNVTLVPNRPSTQCFSNVSGTKEEPVVFYSVTLDSNHPFYSATTNPTGTDERPVVYNNVRLNSNHPFHSATTNPAGTDERPVVYNNVRLDSNHPRAEACSNPNGAIFDYVPTECEYDRMLPSRSIRGSYECRPGIPRISGDMNAKLKVKN